MRGHTICFHREVIKITFELSSVPLLILSSAVICHKSETILFYYSFCRHASKICNGMANSIEPDQNTPVGLGLDCLFKPL